MQEHSEDLELVQTLMVKLRTLRQSAKVRRQTHLRPIIRQHTRWSSTFAMLHRFFEMLPFLDSDDEELVDVLPSAAAKRRLRALLEELKNVESVSKALQGEGVNMLDVRVWFDGLIASKPSYSRYLGCVRVLKRQAKRLTRAEKAALEPFLAAGQSEGEPDAENEAEASFVERLQKRRRLEDQQPGYELLSSIPPPPTSNVVERVFSVARAAFGLQRHSMQLYTLEMLLFLRQNSGYWDARTVENAE
ncbi:hypothetical protein ON010_g8112 [Phytophthora cinnamomi]|nr:hypothetical protein ON010_g8112 [Phytophthora cinnamomi]